MKNNQYLKYLEDEEYDDRLHRIKQQLDEMVAQNDASFYRRFYRDRYSPLKLVILFKLLLAAAKRFSSETGKHLAWENCHSFAEFGSNFSSLSNLFGASTLREANNNPLCLLDEFDQMVASFELHFAPTVIRELISGQASFGDAVEYFSMYLITHYEETDAPRSINHMAIQAMNGVDSKYAAIVPFVFALEDGERLRPEDMNRFEIQALLLLAMAVAAGKDDYKEAVFEKFFMETPNIRTADILDQTLGKDILLDCLTKYLDDSDEEDACDFFLEVIRRGLVADSSFIERCTKAAFCACSRAGAAYLFRHPKTDAAYLTVKDTLAELFSDSVNTFKRDYSITYAIVCLRNKRSIEDAIKDALKDALSADSIYSRLLGLSIIRAASVLTEWDCMSNCPQIPIDVFSVIIQRYLTKNGTAEQNFALYALSDALDAGILDREILNKPANLKVITPLLRYEQLREIAEHILSYTPISCISHADELKDEKNQKLMLHYSSLLELEPKASRYLDRFSILLALGWFDRNSIISNLQSLCRGVILSSDPYHVQLGALRRTKILLDEYINKYAISLPTLAVHKNFILSSASEKQAFELDKAVEINCEEKLAEFVAFLNECMKKQETDVAKALVENCSVKCSLQSPYLITRFFYFLCAFGSPDILEAFYNYYADVLDRPVRVDCSNRFQLVGLLAGVHLWRSDIGFDICSAYNSEATNALSRGRRLRHALETNQLTMLLDQEYRNIEKQKQSQWISKFCPDHEELDFRNHLTVDPEKSEKVFLSYWDEPLCQQFLKAQSFSFYALNKEDPYSTYVCIRKESLK